MVFEGMKGGKGKEEESEEEGEEEVTASTLLPPTTSRLVVSFFSLRFPLFSLLLPLFMTDRSWSTVHVRRGKQQVL